MWESNSPCTNKFNTRAWNSHSRSTNLLQNLNQKPLWKWKYFSSHKDNGQDAGVPSMTVSTNTSACLWSPLQDWRSVHYQQKVVPQKVFNWTKVFSPRSERPPALLQATITVNPSKTVESQQQKTAVSLKQRSLCLSLLRPAEIQLLVSVPLLVVDMLLKWNRCLHWLNLRSGDGNYRRG